MNIESKRKSLGFCFLLTIFLIILSSCANYGSVMQRTWIDFPQPGDQFYPGDAVPITSHYYSEQDAGKVVISVNGQAVKEIESPDQVKPIAKIDQEWIPNQSGEFIIDVAVYTQDEVLLSSAQVEVIVLDVKESEEEAKGPDAEVDGFGELEESAKGIFAQNGFCRYGPGTNYPTIAVYETGYQVTLEARSESLSPLWWYVSDLSGEIYCWVSEVVIETEIDPKSLMAMEPPPVPEPVSDSLSCHKDLEYAECIEAGGTWYTPLDVYAPYCLCP